MDNIKELIIKAKHINNELTSLPSNLYICKVEIDCIPTLQTGIYRRISPMLRERYNNFGSWENATHGDWLSIDDMKELWKEKPTSYIENIKHQLHSCSQNWPNDACSLFKDNRISVFAADVNSFERIYIVWLDEVDEPEIWVYDSNGMARYKNLMCYLEAYLEDDLSAYNKLFI